MSSLAQNQLAIRITPSFSIMHDMPDLHNIKCAASARGLPQVWQVCVRTTFVMIARRSDMFQENTNTTFHTIITSHTAPA